MYLYNKYTNWYNAIIAKALLRVNGTEYLESHHIIPKSIGGTNDKSNLVKLTPKEHFVCHMLLPKMTTGNHKSKMIRAAWMIATMGNKRQTRIRVKSRKYCLLKEEWIKISKGVPKSEEHKQKLRKPKSPEHKQKLSLARKGKTFGYMHSEETKKKISESNKGKVVPPRTDEQKKHQSKMLTGRTYSEEHRKKIGEATRQRGPRSEETKQKIREARAKQVISEETKQKMSASHTARRVNIK